MNEWKSRLGALTPEIKAELAYFLLEGLEESDASVESAWDEVASRRVDEIRSGAVRGRELSDFLDDPRGRV